MRPACRTTGSPNWRSSAARTSANRLDQRARPAAAGTDERGARKDAARKRLSHRARRRATLLPGDLPGYGLRAVDRRRREFEELTRAIFGRDGGTGG